MDIGVDPPQLYPSKGVSSFLESLRCNDVQCDEEKKGRAEVPEALQLWRADEGDEVAGVRDRVSAADPIQSNVKQDRSTIRRFEGNLSLAEFKSFAEEMPKNRNLESVWFSDTKLGYAAAYPLMEAVNKCKSLQYLK